MSIDLGWLTLHGDTGHHHGNAWSLGRAVWVWSWTVHFIHLYSIYHIFGKKVPPDAGTTRHVHYFSSYLQIFIND
jgi:hypothetical protein